MIARIIKNKKTQSPTKKLSKHRQKSKSIGKTAAFNPQEYLEALMQLQNTNSCTSRKRKSTKRNLSSALTIATPALQHTISASKIRSKSSLSQHKKKSKANHKKILNAYAVITEESNIQYTEKTARSNQEDKYKQEIRMLQMKANLKMKNQNETLCAIKIQRAWRNYQTYKMVHQRYLFEKKSRELHKRGIKVPGSHNKLHINIRKQELQRILKIKRKDQAFQKCCDSHSQLKKQTIVKQRCKENNYLSVSNSSDTSNVSPIYGVIDSCEAISVPSKQFKHCSQLTELSKQMKTKQVERVDQVIQLIKRQRKDDYNNESLLYKLVQKLQENKRAAEADINACKIQQSYKQCYQRLHQLQSCPVSPFFHYSHEKSPHHLARGTRERHAYEQQTNREQSRLDFLAQESISSIQSNIQFENLQEQHVQLKIFRICLQNLNSQRKQALQAVESLLQNQKISTSKAKDRKQLIESGFGCKKKQIEKNRKQYLLCVNRLKRNAIKCTAQLANNRSLLSLARLKKSYSAGSTVLKTFVDEIKILEALEFPVQRRLMNNLPSIVQCSQGFFQNLQSQEKINASHSEVQSRRDLRENQLLSILLKRKPTNILNNSPASDEQQISERQIKSHDVNYFDDSCHETYTVRQNQLSEQVRVDPPSQIHNDTKVMKQYSLQIQEQIQKYLVQEITLELYMNENIYRYMHPYITSGYQFTKIRDEQIVGFLPELKKVMPSQSKMLQRVNQKINPTALEILKIIRDINFQIDEYDLIIPEQSFKAYRYNLQRSILYIINNHVSEFSSFVNKSIRIWTLIMSSVQIIIHQALSKIQQKLCFKGSNKNITNSSDIGIFNVIQRSCI